LKQSAYQHSAAFAPVPPLTPVLVSVKLVQSVSFAWGWPATGVAVSVNVVAALVVVSTE
jgi:hypothetical protein